MATCNIFSWLSVFCTFHKYTMNCKKSIKWSWSILQTVYLTFWMNDLNCSQILEFIFLRSPLTDTLKQVPTIYVAVAMKNIMPEAHLSPEVWLPIEAELWDLTGIVMKEVSWWRFFEFEDGWEWIFPSLTLPFDEMEAITMAMLWAKEQEEVTKSRQGYFCVVILLCVAFLNDLVFWQFPHLTTMRVEIIHMHLSGIICPWNGVCCRTHFVRSTGLLLSTNSWRMPAASWVKSCWEATWRRSAPSGRNSLNFTNMACIPSPYRNLLQASFRMWWNLKGKTDTSEASWQQPQDLHCRNKNSYFCFSCHEPADELCHCWLFQRVCTTQQVLHSMLQVYPWELILELSIFITKQFLAQVQ